MKIEMVPGARRKIRYLPSTQRMLEDLGLRVMRRANNTLGAADHEEQGYRMSSRAGKRKPYGRWRVTVAAVTPHAKRHDRKHNTLLKSIGGSGSSSATQAPSTASARRGMWSASELNQLFSGSVAEVAQRTGRSEGAVRSMRQRVGRR